MNFKEELRQKTDEVNRVIRKFLPAEDGLVSELAKAMNYSILAGGKRLRPLFMWECYKMYGGSGQVIAPFMAAMEMLHTHSLVHDDLPAIDNDEFRRGRRTTHAEFGEAMGILSGDALLNYAYEVAFSAFRLEPDNRGIPLALQIFAAKSGIYGMLGGQCLDVSSEGQAVPEELLLYIYQKKTSALLEASVMVGAVLAQASDEDVRKLESMANRVGLAFQIQDDILDVEGSRDELGKSPCSDEKNGKTTYVTLHGLRESHEKVQELSAEALGILDGLEEHSDFLRQLILYLTVRSS